MAKAAKEDFPSTMKTYCGLTPEMLTVFETLPDLYLILSPELIILTASNAYLEATFKKREEIQGQEVFMVFPDSPTPLHAKTISIIRQSLQQVLTTGKPHMMETVRYDLARLPEQGSGFVTRYWQLVNTPVLNDQEKVQYIIIKATDVTDKVIAEHRLEVSRQREHDALAEAERQGRRLHDILMQAPALICIFEGPQHVFKFVNPPYQQLVGDRPLLGRPIAEAMPELAGQPIFSLLDGVYRTGETFYAHEMKVQLDHDNNGQLGHNYYNFVYQATRDLTGNIDGVFVFANQVTEQVQARKTVEALNEELAAANTEIMASNQELRAAYEKIMATNEELFHTQQALRQLNEELEKRVSRRTSQLSASNQQLEEALNTLHEKNFELDQFVYKTSHDLRAPLSTILGLITILKQEEAEAAKYQYVDLIENRVHKLDKFIRSMLDYSRNTRTATTYQPIDFKWLIQECLHELEHMKHFTRLHLSFQVAEGEFYSDAFRLKIIFSNLISNAIKYQDFNKAESLLTIHISFDNRQVLIRLSDNGVGIDQQYQDKLFGMFVRASEQSEGSGLGLYIVKQAVGMLKGKIELESQVGIGTCFMVSIPDAQAVFS